ncbi:MAG: SufE family protein [Rhodobacteraceae bacterium]|nr:SufE family protein [Paracoccaceae bacterium]MCY4196724.1 SufE family protein [Paracoccaceae bacterium]
MATAEFEAIVEDFEFLDEWQDRYRYIIDLGKSMDALPESRRLPDTKVDGCASQVWIVASLREDNNEQRFIFQGDSDAMIVRGLIAILASLYNGVPLGDINRINAGSELNRLSLREHLTAQRSNGLASMVDRIHELATELTRTSSEIDQF